MSRLFLIIVAVFASTILLAQVVSSAEGKYSEARKLAKERSDKLLEKERTTRIEDVKLGKEIDTSVIVNTVGKTKTPPKTKAETDVINAAYLTALNSAKASLKQAKEDLNLANRALLRDSSNSTKIQAVETAKITVKNAEINLKTVLLNKP